MSQLESIREKLYKVLEKGTQEDVLKISQEMDVLILSYMQQNFGVQEITV